MKKLTPYQGRILSTLGLKIDIWSPGDLGLKIDIWSPGDLGLKIDIWSPGDGVSRYKLVPEQGPNSGYWEASHSFPTFIGRKELDAALAALAIVVDLLPSENRKVA